MIPMNNIRFFFQQLSDRKIWDRKFPIVNAILIAVSMLINVTFNGGFCVFVPWAMILQILCFINIITFSWVERTRFCYHTRVCPFDGWRPPLHDPAMVLGMRLTGDKDPLSGLTLESRVVLYHTVYPSHPVKADCACSTESNDNGYFEDYLWKALDFKPMKVLKQVNVWRWESVTLNNERLVHLS